MAIQQVPPASITKLGGKTGRAHDVGEEHGGQDAVPVRLVATGIGGAGKTRLATEVARGCLDRYPDGVWLVELASIRDGTRLAEEVGHALGLLGGHESGEGALGSLRQWLAARCLLLVMDNCEHLVEDVAGLLEAVLPVAPGLSVLATSREVLALPGEVSWTVPPLSLPPATVHAAAELEASETDRGRQTSTDEALRSALALLRDRHLGDDHAPTHA